MNELTICAVANRPVHMVRSHHMNERTVAKPGTNGWNLLISLISWGKDAPCAKDRDDVTRLDRKNEIRHRYL